MKHIFFAYYLSNKGKIAKFDMSRIYFADKHLFFQKKFVNFLLAENIESKNSIILHLHQHGFDFNYKNNLAFIIKTVDALYLSHIQHCPLLECNIGKQVDDLLHILKPYISSQLENQILCNNIIETCSAIEWIEFFCKHGNVSNFHTVCDAQPQLKEIIKSYSKWIFLDKFYEYCELQSLPHTSSPKKLIKV